MVLLRRPRKNDRRTDPFYEFGSFGLTGCHRTNLLHPRNAPRLNGARLAFIQGGNGGARLICLTPPVAVVMHAGDARAEVCWDKDDPSARFLRYEDAPVVTEIDDLAAMLEDVDRSTTQARLASKFRSRTSPLPYRTAESLVRAHREALKAAKRFANRYEETLPFLPDIIDKRRKETRGSLLLEVQGYLPAPAELEQSGSDEVCGTQRPSKCR
jgi:hypothetical protein